MNAKESPLALPLSAVNLSAEESYDFGWCVADANNRVIGVHLTEAQAKQLAAPFAATLPDAGEKGEAVAWRVAEDAAASLRDFIGDEASEIELLVDEISDDDGRVEYGLLCRLAEYPEEGAILLSPMHRAAPPAPRAEGEDCKALYHELLYQVGNKHPGETRHQTALRYLRNAEIAQDAQPAQATGAKP